MILNYCKQVVAPISPPMPDLVEEQTVLNVVVPCPVPISELKSLFPLLLGMMPAKHPQFSALSCQLATITSPCSGAACIQPVVDVEVRAGEWVIKARSLCFSWGNIWRAIPASNFGMSLVMTAPQQNFSLCKCYLLPIPRADLESTW